MLTKLEKAAARKGENVLNENGSVGWGDGKRY